MTGDTCTTAPGHCITCGDEGIPMQVRAFGDGYAVCADAEHAEHEIATDLVEPVSIGDELLVHAGVAIRQLGAAA